MKLTEKLMRKISELSPEQAERLFYLLLVALFGIPIIFLIIIW